MAHLHSVHDSDTHFKIDPVTRAIENETSKTLLMQKDHNSEIFTFELPRYGVDGHDMTMCNRVEAHFVNTDNATKEKNRGHRTIEDLKISPDSEDTVVCSWQLDEDVTRFAGTLAFMLRFACVADDGETEYAWHTASYDKFTVQKNLCKNDDKEVNRVIARASTPTHFFSIPFDTSSVTGVVIIYAQNGEGVFTKKTADCTITDHDVSVTLTQADTLSLKEGTCKAQLVVYSGNNALVSNAIEMTVVDILSEDVAE